MVLSTETLNLTKALGCAFTTGTKKIVIALVSFIKPGCHLRMLLLAVPPQSTVLKNENNFK